MRISTLIAITLTLPPVMSGFAASPGPPEEHPQAQMKPVVDLLSKRTDADSLAAAGLLSVYLQKEQALRLLAQATLIEPERADLLWLQVRICQDDASCDPDPLERRLRGLDEKNGAGWFVALAHATSSRDEAARSAALAAIARSERVDTYWTTLIARLARPIASTGKVSPLNATAEVIGVLAGISIPGYANASNACRGERLENEDTVKACRGIANALLNGDTIITESLGVEMTRRVWPEGSPKWLEAAEVKRLRDYRNQFTHPVGEWVLARPEEYLALCAQHRREQDVEKAMLMELGEDPDPASSE